MEGGRARQGPVGTALSEEERPGEGTSGFSRGVQVDAKAAGGGYWRSSLVGFCGPVCGGGGRGSEPREEDRRWRG